MRYRSEQKPVNPLSKYLSTGQAAIEFEQSTLKAAQIVLSAMLKEFRAAGKSGRELSQIMDEEIEAAVNSYELPTIQRDLLRLELDLYKREGDSPAAATTQSTHEAGEPSTTAKPVTGATGGGDGTRAAFITPILEKKGWSILDWANNSGVDFHTANDYLRGSTKPYASTRKKLADSLGVTVDELPK
jgi:hypothetical protein